ncbi:ABC transporter ATP-binding protein [Candidatus Bathyarchaeota archaeon]|nr:ABC transporter ATP-binding protein [Candidatus Bathyarchaeota archaeon]
MSLLEVEDLTTYYRTLRGYVKAVENCSFSINKGEALGLAGESGCGKTTIALSLLRILPPGGKIVQGKIIVNGTDIVKLQEEKVRKKIRWKEISLVFQGAMNAMNPVIRVKDQIVEAIKLHEHNISKKEAEERVKKLFELVGVEPSRADNYPFEFSGGMRQRAMIAMAVACSPKLLIADEPGTALDVIVQAQVIKLLEELKSKLGMTLILISHDLSLIAEVCEKTAIMYAGNIVEIGDSVSIFKNPLHPYTKGLVLAFPNIKSQKVKMISIPGSPPDLLNPPTGCRFHPRCQYAMEVCKKIVPPLETVEENHKVACHLVNKKNA